MCLTLKRRGAAGAALTCPDETAEAVRASAVAMGERARAMGVYGPEVAVPAAGPRAERDGPRPALAGVS
ncbi:hypothetical protein [Amycolatopsis sp. NPDC051903]|uniref:hypothetical protein n=1 Tax=Amycolatopsis sp. NPDC051903 TaxID=3363936 RepID=UPI0037A26E62